MGRSLGSQRRKHKKRIVRVIGSQNLTFEEYGTLLSQIVACINSRPISSTTDDLDNLRASTHGHFLVGRGLITLSESEMYEFDQNAYRKRWEMLQQFHQEVWTK